MIGNTKDSVVAARREAAKRSRIDDIGARGEELGFAEVAQVLGLAVSTVKTWTYTRQIPAYRIFGNVVFYRAEIEAYKNRMTRPI